MFLFKCNTKRIVSKFYFGLSVLAIISMIVLMVAGACAVHGKINLATVLARIQIFLTLEWISFLVFYFSLAFKKDDGVEFTTKKYNKLMHVFGIVSLILNIVCCIFLPFNYSQSAPRHAFVMGGLLDTYYKIWGVFILLTAIFFLVKDRKTTTTHAKTIIWLFFVIYAIAYLIVYLLKIEISNIPFLMAAIQVVLYLSVESQDKALLDEFNTSIVKADESNKLRSEFIMNMSHQFRTPMNTIVSLSESICNMEVYDDNQVVEDLNNIKYAGNLLLDSINNILDRNEADSADSINLREYSVIELINRLKSVTLSRIGAKQVSFDVEIDPNVSSKLNGDISKIQKVLLNILNNSVKFTDVGKIKFNISATMGKDNTQIIHFKVSDTGCGINDSQKSFVFSGSQSDKSGGGLSVSKKYIEAMNGEIRFESNFAAGTTFYVDIPQGIVGSRLISEDMVDTGSSNINEAVDFSNCKILVVDDDNLDIKVTTRLLQRYKVQVMSITSSLECIDRIKREEEFDLIFLDHKMPDFDGVDT